MTAIRRAAVGLVALALAIAGLAATPQPVAASWERTLSVQFAFGENLGDGAGHVTSDDGGIDCTWSGYAASGDCSEHYVLPNFQTSYDVTLTFDPNTGSVACTNVSSGCAATNENAALPIHFDLGTGGDLTVRGSFSLAFVRVQVAYMGPGTVTSNAQFPCTPSPSFDVCFSYKYGNSVSLTAHPESGYPFTHWLGYPCEATATYQNLVCSFTITGDVALTAVMGYVSLTIHSSTGGYVCEYGGTLCLDGGQSALRVYRLIGTTQWFDAAEKPGYTFDHWDAGPCAGKTVRCSFTLTQATDLSATFKKLATPAPSVKPTPRPTAGPGASSAPATPAPAATVVPTSAQSSDPGTRATPSPIPDGTANDLPSFDSTVAASVPPAPTPAPSAISAVDGGTTGSTPDLVLLLVLFTVTAIVIMGIGFTLGRRGREAAHGQER